MRLDGWFGAALLGTQLACGGPVVPATREAEQRNEESDASAARSSDLDSRDASVVDAGADASLQPNDGGVDGSAAVADGPVDLDEFLRRWNAEPMKAEYRLARPKRPATVHEFPIGILWCAMKVTTDRGGFVTRATLEHEAKASYDVPKWSCAFAEQAMVAALSNDPDGARAVLARLPPTTEGSNERTESLGMLKVTRRSDGGHGSVTVVRTKTSSKK